MGRFKAFTSILIIDLFVLICPNPCRCMFLFGFLKKLVMLSLSFFASVSDVSYLSNFI